jgi:hypothetical protein
MDLDQIYRSAEGAEAIAESYERLLRRHVPERPLVLLGNSMGRRKRSPLHGAGHAQGAKNG